MKCIRLSRGRYCCCYYHNWLTILLIATVIVNVSPEISTKNVSTLCDHKKPLAINLYSILPKVAPNDSRKRPAEPLNMPSTIATDKALMDADLMAINTKLSRAINSRTTTSLAAQGATNGHLHTDLNSTQQSPSPRLSVPYDQRSAHSRQPREAPEQFDRCRLFVEGEPGKNELYSPDYPNDYPKNINCTKIITAPKGQIIRLDFRNSFHIEDKEDCKFDFLEIRDGQYGFSNLIGKYCGTDFPPEITSKERYLWIHFHSDESIEYSGFTAVYEFIDRNREAPSTDLNCTIEKDGFEGIINATDALRDIKKTVIESKIPLDCMWRIQVQDNWKIQIKFLDFKLSKPNDCDTNFIDIFPEQTVMPLRVKNFCGSAGEGISSDSNVLHIRFYAEPMAINSTFTILYTAFRDKGAACTEDEYDCEDATCISKDMRCNDHDNCKFRWDEEGCPKEPINKSEHVIIIITVFGLILGGMVVTFLVNCIRKIMRDQKIIREHIRQSKESKLDEMGRNSKGRSRDNLSTVVSPKQKHLQTSLRNIDDISSQFYKPDLKEKEHSILRHHQDIYVQASLCGGDASSTTTANTADRICAAPANACDMACQTRESLFATQLLQRKSSVGGCDERLNRSAHLSTFSHDTQQSAVQPHARILRHSIRIPHQPSADIENRHHYNTTGSLYLPAQQQHHQQQHHHQQQQQREHEHEVLPSKPPEVCQHHQKHHLQQQHQQQQQQQQAQNRHPSNEQSVQRINEHVQHSQKHQHNLQQQQQQQQQQLDQPQQQQHKSQAVIIPLRTVGPVPGGSTAEVKPPTTTRCTTNRTKPQKEETSKVLIDIRNSAPDVIIMTSH